MLRLIWIDLLMSIWFKLEEDYQLINWKKTIIYLLGCHPFGYEYFKALNLSILMFILFQFITKFWPSMAWSFWYLLIYFFRLYKCIFVYRVFLIAEFLNFRFKHLLLFHLILSFLIAFCTFFLILLGLTH